jgi:hypothetical protein
MQNLTSMTWRGAVFFACTMLTGFSAGFGVMSFVGHFCRHGAPMIGGLASLFFFGFLFWVTDSHEKRHPGRYFKIE